MSEKKVDLKYLEVPATVDADVTVNLEVVLNGLNLEELKAVREFVNEMIEIYEEEET